VIEDYKSLDVECAAVNLALLTEIRSRYPDWRLLVDGDGGDENLKDYPIEENRELTIRSVVNNRMLYQEGWGVDSIKHSLTYSGGYSRGCVRGYACSRARGFTTFSPYTRRPSLPSPKPFPSPRLPAAPPTGCMPSRARSWHAASRSVLNVDMPSFPSVGFRMGRCRPPRGRAGSPRTRRANRRHFETLHAAGA